MNELRQRGLNEIVSKRQQEDSNRVSLDPGNDVLLISPLRPMQCDRCYLGSHNRLHSSGQVPHYIGTV